MTHVSRLCGNLLGDNDVEFFVRLFALLYADDTIVLAESEQDLQSALVGVYEYCDRWHLKVNTDKTKVVIFSRGKITKHRNFFFGSLPIETVEDYTYLGMVFNYNGTYNKAIQKQIKQGTKAMYSLLTKCRRLCLPIDITCELFEKLVVPVLTYGCEIWGCGNLIPLEIFYKKFLKIILKLNTQTPSVIVYGEVGKLPIRTIIYRRMISYWIRVSEEKNTKFSNIMFSLIFKLHSRGSYFFQWPNKIKTLLDTCHFGNLWRDQENYSTKKHLKNAIFKELDRSEKENWLNEINNSCFIYRIFKQNLSFEPYLVKLPFLHRLNFSKFRCKNNKLPVNLFDENADKTCPLCNSGDLGDEYHYIFLCNSFSNERKLYIQEYFYSRPNTLKMSQLFNSQNLNTLIKLCKFIAIILEKFK